MQWLEPTKHVVVLIPGKTSINQTLRSELINEGLLSDGKNLSANLFWLRSKGSQYAVYILKASEPF